MINPATLTNFCMNIVDDTLKANMDFHYRSGLSPKIVRISDGHCCDWCSNLAGTYSYPNGTPHDIFRRHKNCRCETLYDPGDGSRRQDVWNKRWRKLSEVDDKVLSLNQHKKGQKVFITDQAITKVKRVNPEGYTDQNVEESAKARERLLQYSKTENNSDECSAIYNLVDNGISGFMKGTNDTVAVDSDVDAFHWLHTSDSRTLEIVHNHPGLSYFSLNDINVFFEFRSVKPYL